MDLKGGGIHVTKLTMGFARVAQHLQHLAHSCHDRLNLGKVKASRVPRGEAPHDAAAVAALGPVLHAALNCNV